MSQYRLIKLFLAFLLSSTLAFGASCDRRLFSIKISDDNTSIKEILSQLSSTCDFSIIVADRNASSILGQDATGINIKSLSLSDIFDILITHNDLSYTFNKKVLKVATTESRTFKLDYITSIREGRAVTRASTDSAPTELENLSDQNENNTDLESQENIIKITEKFDFWTQLQAEILAIMNNGVEHFAAPAPVVNPNAGLITVTGTKTQINRVARYINNLNKSLKKQVMIDVRIISIQLENEFSKGIDWSKFNLKFNSNLGDGSPSSFKFGRRGNDPSPNAKAGTRSNRIPFQGTKYEYSYTGEDGDWITREIGNAAIPTMRSITGGFILGGGVDINLEGVINFLETKGNSKVISSPKVMTMNNQQAIISVGDNINYQITSSNVSSDTGTTVTQDVTQYSTFIGILLNILPEVSDDGKIMLRINPSLNTFKYQEDNVRQTAARSIAPDTLQKKLSTVVQVNSGDTIVLGGLISQETGKNVNKVPVLGDIPAIGYLFKNVKDSLRDTELVFIITPKVVNINETGNVKDSLKSLGYSDGIL